ncbi:MAG: YkgJ family cysteine cluster protein [Candidatus Lindowbacteria bacterium]|nr:YkgJ family cysteine cluster protein [Candidatus Lindowbacteria bacterium]
MTSRLATSAADNIEEFKCCGCGACCWGWAVELDEPSERVILDHLAKAPHPIYGKEIPTRIAGPKKFLKTVDDHCVFLESNNRCYLHDNFGEKIKPFVCTVYPNRIAPTPGKTIVALSPSCHVAAGIIIKDKTQLFSKGEMDATLVAEPEPMELCNGIPLSEEETALLEIRIDQFLDEEDRSFPEKLMRTCQFLESLVETIQETSGSFVAAMNAIPSNNPELTPPAVSEQLKILTSLLDHRQAIAEQTSCPSSLKKFFTLLNDTYSLNDSSARPPAVIRYSRTLKNHFDTSADKSACSFSNWARYHVKSRYFTRTFGFRDGINILCFLYTLVRATSAAIASKNQSDVNDPILADAISMVEQQFTHSAIVLQFWKSILDIPNARKAWFLGRMVL